VQDRSAGKGRHARAWRPFEHRQVSDSLNQYHPAASVIAAAIAIGLMRRHGRVWRFLPWPNPIERFSKPVRGTPRSRARHERPCGSYRLSRNRRALRSPSRGRAGRGL